MDALAMFFLLAPAGLTGVALLARHESGPRPTHVLHAARIASGSALALALLAGLLVWLAGPLESPTLGIGAFGLSIRLDALSAVMFWLVTLVGALLIQFSRHYLDGDEGQGRFVGGLCLTLAAVLMLVLAGNLFQLVAAWIGTSLALHRLLLFYRDRPAAVAAARKKFVVARLGDVCLVIAAFLLADAFGTSALGALLESAAAAAASGAWPTGATVAAVLVVIAAALKSAMFPTHGWLLEVMETPTPVSALLHAGLINAGTFLVVRLGDAVMPSGLAVALLMIIGGFTALFASLAMITQSSVKVSLAYSSAAHMGFMLLLCGLGAHAAAILHLVAHSFYKAHAFLSSGSIVESVRATGPQDLGAVPGPVSALASLATALLLFIGIGSLLGIELAERPGTTTLGALFVMAMAHLVSRALVARSDAYVLARTSLSAAIVSLAFFALEATASWLLGGATTVVPEAGAGAIALMGLVIASFAGVLIFQSLIPARSRSLAWNRVYVHLKNGLYANVAFDRITGSLR